MTLCDTCDNTSCWDQFLLFIKGRISATAFGNWLAPIKTLEISESEITLEIPNIFVKEYLLSNHKEELCAFLPVTGQGEPALTFIVSRPSKPKTSSLKAVTPEVKKEFPSHHIKLNEGYTFNHFIDGTNQFVKSAAMGVANRPGKSYNPLFIHGDVGLGKTHLLHSIGHHVSQMHKKLRVQCITTEAFINDLVDHLKNKSVERMKRFYRKEVDVLLFDDIQFLQNRRNFEEEFENTIETFINQNKQIVITSDKPPKDLKLSSRMIARMEWGLVARIEPPDLETRVAILQHKAQQKSLSLSNDLAFHIAEQIHQNVRQLEGAVNRLSAHSRLLDVKVSEELVNHTLKEILRYTPKTKISIDQILSEVAKTFHVAVEDLKGSRRTKDIAIPRQVAMYLASRLMQGTLQQMSEAFQKAHSTVLHAIKNIEKKMGEDRMLKEQIKLAEQQILYRS